VVLGRALLPLVLGLGAARLSPRAAAKVGPVLGLIINIVLGLALVLAIVATGKLLVQVGTGWLVAGAVAVGAVLIGHVLGGPDPGSRGVVAASASMRFPALALVLAHAMPHGQQLIPVVLVYVILAFLSMTVYGAVVARRQKRERHVAPISALPQRA
jgi:BASS family bile acid:Na+ symporter